MEYKLKHTFSFNRFCKLKLRQKYRAVGASLMALMILLFSGCSIYDKEEDCDPVYKVKFIYDMTMSGGDAFSSQVNSVDLWVFEHESGEFVAKYSDAGSQLASKSYYLELTDLKPGTYDFIVWGGLENSRSFSVPSEVASLSDLKCTLKTQTQNGQPVSDQLLSPLFYGSLIDQSLLDKPGEHVYTVNLMKDTNNINLSLQHMSDETLDASEFTIYMTDTNGNLSYSNNTLAEEDVYYYPWSLKSGAIDMPGEELNYIRAEISTSRLMADSSPVITIKANETGNTVYSIPIVEWAKVLRSQQNMSMTDQEYLDREHEYTIMLYLSAENEGWKAVSIVINGYEMK